MNMITLAPNPNRELWEKGDFTRIAETMRDSGESLVAGLGVEPGMHILDLGCGDGTTALPAARRGAYVLGVDIAANLVAAGNARAAQAGLSNLRFRQGDATNLAGVADDKFDLVVSIFGAMFAPDPYAAAREMVRVARPGGRIVMGNWIPGDPTLVAQILKISSAFSPAPPPGFVSPMLWGNEAEVRSRFVAAGIDGDDVKFERRTWWFATADGPLSLLATFRDYYGPTMNAFAAAKANGLAIELERELADLFIEANQGGESTLIPATFLQVTVDKR
jgi:SAM-dependent methyltransferase